MLSTAVITPSGRALLGSWGGVETGTTRRSGCRRATPSGSGRTRRRRRCSSTPSLLVGPSFGTTLGEQHRARRDRRSGWRRTWSSRRPPSGDPPSSTRVGRAIALPDPGNRSQAMTPSLHGRQAAWSPGTSTASWRSGSSSSGSGPRPNGDATAKRCRTSRRSRRGQGQAAAADVVDDESRPDRCCRQQGEGGQRPGRQLDRAGLDRPGRRRQRRRADRETLYLWQAPPTPARLCGRPDLS